VNAARDDHKWVVLTTRLTIVITALTVAIVCLTIALLVKG
jgi:hypothetical protein